MKKATRAWVRKAENDYQLATQIAAGPEPFHDQLCFHCQQSAEKYLKGSLPSTSRCRRAAASAAASVPVNSIRPWLQRAPYARHRLTEPLPPVGFRRALPASDPGLHRHRGCPNRSSRGDEHPSVGRRRRAKDEQSGSARDCGIRQSRPRSYSVHSKARGWFRPLAGSGSSPSCSDERQTPLPPAGGASGEW
jgi:hypothetical protein